MIESILSLLALVAAAAFLLRRAARRARRRELFLSGLEPGCREFLEPHLPWIRHLTASERLDWEGHVRVFLDEKTFEGCRGQEVTDEMRWLIAADACRLVIGRPAPAFKRLSSILIYPAEFRVKTNPALGPHAWLEDEELRIGESWGRGAVILSWDEIDPRRRDLDLFGNVVLHEFAHQLDAENGEDDGVPILDRSLSSRWRDVMAREYKALSRAVKAGKDTLIDPYGAENPAEFFAVVTEHYFEEPHALQEEHPELHKLLKDYYRVDGVEV